MREVAANPPSSIGICVNAVRGGCDAFRHLSLPPPPGLATDTADTTARFPRLMGRPLPAELGGLGRVPREGAARLRLGVWRVIQHSVGNLRLFAILPEGTRPVIEASLVPAETASCASVSNFSCSGAAVARELFSRGCRRCRRQRDPED